MPVKGKWALTLRLGCQWWRVPANPANAVSLCGPLLWDWRTRNRAYYVDNVRPLPPNPSPPASLRPPVHRLAALSMPARKARLASVLYECGSLNLRISKLLLQNFTHHWVVKAQRFWGRELPWHLRCTFSCLVLWREFFVSSLFFSPKVEEKTKCFWNSLYY